MSLAALNDIAQSPFVQSSLAQSSLAQGSVAQSSLAQRLGITLASHLYVASVPVLSSGMPALDRVLPDQGVPQGQVIELSAASSSSLSTTLSLALCREAQQQAALQGGESWCAFIDPAGTLYAPGVAQAGVVLERLLVLRPPLEVVSNVAAKLAEARAFSVIVVDLRACVQNKQWQRMVRRMALAIESSKTTVLLLTDEVRGKSVLNTLPVGLRIQLQRQEVDHLTVSVTKDRQGRLREAQQIRLPRRRAEERNTLRAIKPLRSIRPASANAVSSAQLPSAQLPSSLLSLSQALEKVAKHEVRPARPKLALVSSAPASNNFAPASNTERRQLNLFGGA
jgi:recombination protein RecA